MYFIYKHNQYIYQPLYEESLNSKSDNSSNYLTGADNNTLINLNWPKNKFYERKKIKYEFLFKM